MSLSRYFRIAFRWLWLVVVAVALSSTASYIYSQRLPKVYVAKSTVTVGSNFAEALNPDAKELQLSLTLAEVYSELAKRAKITQGVVDRVFVVPESISGTKVVSGTTKVVSNTIEPITAGQLGGMIDTVVIPRAQLLEISVRDVSPERAAFLANAVADELVLQSPTRAQTQKQGEEFIKTQLDEVKTKILEINVYIAENRKIAEEDESAVNREEARSLVKEYERQKFEQQANYSNLLANMSSSAVNRIDIFEYAAVPGSPAGPNVRMNVIAAGVVGLVLALAAIIVIEFFDDTLVWQGEGATTIDGIQILGGIGKATSGDSKIITHDKLWSPEANALRELRDSIFLATEDRTISTLLLTSPLAGEGKTYITANLGVTLASSPSAVLLNKDAINKNIILVDADLRKPALHEIFDIPNVVGLSDVLVTPPAAMEATLKQAIRPTYLDNLFLLPAGRTLTDPGSLLNSLQFTEIIRYLKERSQLIIIDSAPILEAVETKAIDNISDGTLLVVSDGYARQKFVNMTVEYFNSKRNNTFLGLVFNRVKLPYGQEYQSGQTVYGQQFEESFLGRFWSSKRRQKTQSTLSLAEAAIHLGVKEETVRRWCEAGRIPGIKTGSRWKVRLEDLEEYITFYKLNNAGVEKVLKKQPAPFTDWISHSDAQKFDELPASVDVDNHPVVR
jgi:capsular exopolysaccharide synthesis family protein